MVAIRSEAKKFNISCGSNNETIRSFSRRSPSMMSVLNIVVHIIAAFLLCQVVGAIDIKKNSTKSTGICHLEVPTIDLISENERATSDLKGNGSRPGYSKIQICCSGYKLKPHTAFACEPHCDDGCEHGNCTAPNFCECHKNYIKGPQQTCVPVCPIGCLNGICSVNNVCSCNSGYVPDPSGKYCNPSCSNGCGTGGECVGPNECRCKPGYKKNENGTCEFECAGGCNGGDCIGPNVCACKKGYQTTSSGCSPICLRGCKNGECTAPEKCTCSAGWTLDQSGALCEAHCSLPCLNGECTGPDQCTCKKGYIKDSSIPSGYRCVADCPGGCENGVCSAPNFCICNLGYMKQAKGSNVCVKRIRRSNFHPELIPVQP